MLFMQTEVFFFFLYLSSVFKHQRDTTCTALKSIKTGCFFINDGEDKGKNFSQVFALYHVKFMAYQQILKTNTMIPQSESFNLPSTKPSASNQKLL